jgi:hypothetical protein
MSKQQKVLIQSKNVSLSSLRKYFLFFFWLGIGLGVISFFQPAQVGVALGSWIFLTLGLLGKLLSLTAEAILEGLDGNMFDRDYYESNEPKNN